MSRDYSAMTPQEQVLHACRKMLRIGLTGGTSGNISMRAGQIEGVPVIAISPSSVDYEDMELADVVLIDLGGRKVAGELEPSSEWQLHTECYRLYPEIEAVVHTHPLYASMFAVTRQPIPVVLDEFSVYVGGEVPCSDYAMAGSADLATNVALELRGVSTALIANHGMTSIASNVRKALQHSWVVERSAHIVWGARMLGQVHEIPRENVDMFASVYRWSREAGKS